MSPLRIRAGREARAADAVPLPRDCRRHFSVRTGTVFAHSKLPLQKWLLAAHLLTTARKGVSSVQLARHLDVTRQTAWFLAHRLREAFELEGGPLAGTVESDECYIGGKERNKHARRRLRRRSRDGKQVVAGLRERGGGVVAYTVPDTTARRSKARSRRA